MKTCPYCAEEIQDAAIKCRHCGSDLTEGRTVGPSPTVVPGAPPASPPVHFSHNGQRYLLGYGPDFFGIWDRQDPGAPIQRFTRSEEGWGQAWAQFVVLEPQAQAIPQDPSQAAGVAGQPPTATRTNGLAIASLVLGIVFWGVGSLFALIFGIMAKNQIDRSGGTQTGRGMAIEGIVLGSIGLGFLVLAIIVIASNSGSGF